MDFSLNDDHVALRDAVQRFCETEYPAPRRGEPEAPELARQRWHAMASMGMLGMAIGTGDGGGGQGAVEVMLTAQALGGVLAGGGFVTSSVMAAQLLQSLGNEAQRAQWLPGLASGHAQAAIAVYEDGMRYDWRRVAVRATPQDGGWRIDGRKTGVLHGDRADLLLVVARTGGDIGDGQGLSVFALDATAPGVSAQPHFTLDGRTATHFNFNGVQLPGSRVLGAVGGAAPALEAALDAGIAALCAEAVGAVEALLVQTAEHLRTRRQFGAPLARFQSLQHRVADMAIALEQLKSMACAAAMALEGGDALQRRRIVSGAKVLVGQLGRKVALEAIQLHGAMGMTDECRVGHYAKRLLVIGQLWGDAAWHLKRVGASSGFQDGSNTKETTPCASDIC